MSENGVILLVEDDEDLNDANRRALELRRYMVYTAFTLAGARDILARIEPDIILLDVMMPDGSGFDFCDEIRERTQAHILFLTVKRDLEDSVRGLESGGDDYIKKPFHVEELLARVEASMRRRVRIGIPMETITIGSLTLDLTSNRALAGNTDLLLSKKQFALLRQLVKNEGRTVKTDALYEAVWGQPMNNDTGAIKYQVSQLRSKLMGRGFKITAKRGEGYCFKRE